MVQSLPDEVIADVVDLLVACPAFQGVDRDALAELASMAEIAYLDEVTDPTSPALVVMRGGLVVVDDDDRTLDLVASGEFAAPPSGERLRPVEPSVVVWLPDQAVDLAWSAGPTVLRADVLDAARLRPDLQTAPVRLVMTSPVESVDADASCREAATRMRRRRVSSLLVTGRGELGIVTDRDLRSRLVAEGRSPDTPVGEIATFPVRTVEARDPVFETLVEMLARGVHHLPVVEGGRIVGMVTSDDLLELGARNPMHLRNALDRAVDVDGVRDALATLPASVEALLDAGTGAAAVGRIVATVSDRVTRRVIELVTAGLGAPPGPFGWVVFGSQGRHEQTLHSDQDHGLLLADGAGPEDRAWFAALGDEVTGALERCGFPRCPGGVMACNPAWRNDAAGWRRRFRRWYESPTGDHVLGATIAFDLRTAVGDLDVRPALGDAIREAADNHVFLAHLAREAVAHRPPLGFLGRFAVERSGEHAGAFDVKRGVMAPIADLARLQALASGGAEVGTDERLQAARERRRLSGDLADTLRAGYELAMALRLRLHLRQHRLGVARHDHCDPQELPPLVRSQLREAFTAIRVAQDAARRRWHTGMLG